MRTLVVALLISLLPDASRADDVPSGFRTALLVGNAAYDGIELPGVKASLDTVEHSLVDRGFVVARHRDLDEKALKAVFDEFARSVPTNGVAVVYYVGLAANVDRLGRTYNLLRPVGTEIKNDGDYRGRGTNLADVGETFRESSGAGAVLWFVDGCWDSPIKPETDNVRGGLREFEVDPRTAVLFAAGSGKVVPVPAKDEATPLARSIEKHLAGFDESVEAGGRAISGDLEGPWFETTVAGGLGKAPRSPVVTELRAGRTPGEGYANSVGMTFRWCPPGRFEMGSSNADDPATRDRTPVDVEITRGFWMGEHEVTQREYGVVTRKNVNRGFTEGPNVPYWGATEPKSVHDFCKKLNELERKAGRLPAGWEYACPTEAEWEYACRAGSTSRFCFGDDVADLGSYGNVADAALHAENPNHHWAERRTDDGVGEALAPVGRYRPNAWGLRDVHGNVAELVADHLVPDRPGGRDPLVTLEKDGRTQLRGGAWCSVPLYCESSFRNALTSRDKLNYVGFRIALRRTTSRDGR